MLLGGLDVGRYFDRTALVGIDGATVSEAHLIPPLPFSEQAAILEPLLRRMDITLVDMTGLGIGLYERVVDAGPLVVGCVLTATRRPLMMAADRSKGRGPPRIHVGKRYLIGRAVAMVSGRKLTVAPECRHREELKDELGRLAATHTKTGRIAIAARTGHDDLAIALGLAILAKDLSSRLLARRVCRDDRADLAPGAAAPGA